MIIGCDWAPLGVPLLMDFPHDKNMQFDLLTDALEDPGTDLQTVLALLIDDLRAAIPSVLGLTITVTQAGDSVTLSSWEPQVAATAAASLHIPLTELIVADPGSTVTFYATKPGAFVDLAADIRYAYGLDGQVIFDGHLDDPLPAVGTSGGTVVTGLAEFLVVNRAIGVLIGQRHPPDSARGVLQHDADQAGTTLGAAAQRLLDERTPAPER